MCYAGKEFPIMGVGMVLIEHHVAFENLTKLLWAESIIEFVTMGKLKCF